MTRALETLELKLREAQADRDRMAGSLEKSSIAHQAALKEIEELKRKLAEKD